ncbi:pro-sigmaK processing inhibitor BofA family protein [Candidatus Micrarchaeota archaeon]|nr:pro-sigmaK processing inhibitor BofA family protein [Candidatus Micrarchaeota archaeon]
MVIEFLTLLLFLIFFALAYEVIKKIMPLLLNSIAGLIIFWIFSLFNIAQVKVDLLSILIVAFGGIPGVVFVLILHWLGIAF